MREPLRVKARTKRQKGSELEDSSDMERQTTCGGPEQLQFDWSAKASAGPGKGGETAGGATLSEVKQMSAADERTRALEQELMARVADEANLVEALRRVCANKGSAGLDRMSVPELRHG